MVQVGKKLKNQPVVMGYLGSNAQIHDKYTSLVYENANYVIT